MTISLKALHEKREQLKAGLAQISDLRRGSLIARFRKCGKPNCHCAQKDSPGHGPLLLADSCQRWKDHHPSPPRYPSAGSNRHTTQTIGHALDSSWCQRHYCPALLEVEWPLSGFLGAQIRTDSGMPYNFFAVHSRRVDEW